jgi:hypothetical protein
LGCVRWADAVDCAFYDFVSSLGPAAAPQRCFWGAPVHREIETAEHYRAPSRRPENCRDASRKKNSRENEILAENLGSFATLDVVVENIVVFIQVAVA